MEEPKDIRTLRRGLSQALTKSMNDANAYSAVRGAVLRALNSLWMRLEEVRAQVWTRYRISKDQRLLFFYMKGGNAFECVMDPNGSAATLMGGGESDWDTQIVVDPWAPAPVQEYLYSLIQDTVSEELKKCGVAVATTKPNLQTPHNMTVSTQGGVTYLYRVQLDEQQTSRQIFDVARTGLWLNTRQKLVDQTVPGAVIPGMIFNDGIAPFQLLRLGYTWHTIASPILAAPQGQVLGPPIKRSLLMELIDVTLPRRGTIEAVEVWESFHSKEMLIVDAPVTVMVNQALVTVQLPLPTLAYHFSEQVLMLCEIAAGVSKSADKCARRMARLVKIYQAGTEQVKRHYQAMLAEAAGISLAALQNGVPTVSSVNETFTRFNGGQYVNLQQGCIEYEAMNMMYVVAARVLQLDATQCRAAREVLRILIERLLPGLIAEVAPTDDLALYARFVRNGYLDSNLFAPCGITMAAILRVADVTELETICHEMKRRIAPALTMLAGLIAHVTNEPEAWLVNTIRGKTLRVELREHRTTRAHGSESLEGTLVLFANDHAFACLTLTGASHMENPFTQDPFTQGVRQASSTDLGEQRKVAAAMIKDFSIRSALSLQLQFLNAVAPGLRARL